MTWLLLRGTTREHTEFVAAAPAAAAAVAAVDGGRGRRNSEWVPVYQAARLEVQQLPPGACRELETEVGS